MWFNLLPVFIMLDMTNTTNRRLNRSLNLESFYKQFLKLITFTYITYSTTFCTELKLAKRAFKNPVAEIFIIDKSKTQGLIMKLSNAAFRIRSFLCTFQSAFITQVDKITLHAV